MTSLKDKIFAGQAFKTPKHKPIVLQRTEMETRAACPHQANLLEEHKKEADTHDVLPTAGNEVHDVAKVAVEACNYDLQEAADFIQQELPKTRPDLQPECLRAGRHLANMLRRFGTNFVMLSEKAVTRPLAPATAERGEVLVVTEPDMVLATNKPDSIVVLDYKTGHKDRTNEEAQDEFQTCVTCWVLWGMYPEAKTIHFWYLNTRINTRSYARLERERDEANFGVRIMMVWRLVETKDDSAWPEPKKCSWCPVTKWCKLATLEAKELDDDPKAYVDKVVVLERRLKEMHKAIDVQCKMGRTLYGTGGHFDDAPKRKSYPIVSFKEEKTAEKKKAKKAAAKKPEKNQKGKLPKSTEKTD